MTIPENYLNTQTEGAGSEVVGSVDSLSQQTDTLTSSYSGEWVAMEQMDQSSAFVQFMGSNDLIFVVLGVSLLIWFILLFFMIRTDRKLSKLESSMEESLAKSTEKSTES